jgi:hypothetical protein
VFSRCTCAASSGAEARVDGGVGEEFGGTERRAADPRRNRREEAPSGRATITMCGPLEDLKAGA